MSNEQTSKTFSTYDQQQVLKKAMNVDGTLGTNGFLAGKVGHKVKLEQVSGTVDIFRFYDIQLTTTGNLATSAPHVTGLSQASTDKISVGMHLIATNVANDVTVLSIDKVAGTVTLSSAPSGALGGTTLKFGFRLLKYQIVYDNAAHDNVLDAENIE